MYVGVLLVVLCSFLLGCLLLPVSNSLPLPPISEIIPSYLLRNISPHMDQSRTYHTIKAKHTYNRTYRINIHLCTVVPQGLIVVYVLVVFFCIDCCVCIKLQLLNDIPPYEYNICTTHNQFSVIVGDMFMLGQYILTYHSFN